MRKRMPPFVQKHGAKFRGWAMAAGKRVYGPSRETPQEAHRDAMTMRDASAEKSTRLQDAVQEMLEEVDRTLSKGTSDFWRLQWRAILEIIPGETLLELVSANALRHLIRTKLDAGYSAQTIHHYRSAVNRLFRWSRRRGYRVSCDVADVEWPKPRSKKADVMSPEELRSYFDRIQEVSETDYAVIILIAYTGMRRSEVARIKSEDIEVSRKSIWIRGKTRNESAPLHGEALRAAEFLARSGGYAVSGETETQRVEWIKQLFKRWSYRFRDRRFHAHALRHSLGTLLARRGVSPSLLQRAMRHKSFQTTQRYIHMTSDDVIDVARGVGDAFGHDD